MSATGERPNAQPDRGTLAAYRIRKLILPSARQFITAIAGQGRDSITKEPTK